MILTEKIIHSLAPLKQTDYFHNRTPRAGVRVTKGGRRKSFFIYYKSPQSGSNRRAWLGEHVSGAVLGGGPYLSLNEFEVLYVKFRKEIREGIDPLPIIHGAKRHVARHRLTTRNAAVLQKAYCQILEDAKSLIERMKKENES